MLSRGRHLHQKTGPALRGQFFLAQERSFADMLICGQHAKDQSAPALNGPFDIAGGLPATSTKKTGPALRGQFFLAQERSFADMLICGQHAKDQSAPALNGPFDIAGGLPATSTKKPAPLCGANFLLQVAGFTA